MIKLNNGELIPSVFSSGVVPICFSANDSYISQTAVMIKSIIENANDDKNYDFIILSTDICEENEKIVSGFKNGKDNISIRIFDISCMLDNVVFYTDSVYTPTTYSKEAYFRLFIPFTMSDYDRVIYFDGDMTAISDVSPLMDIDMTGKIAAATRDFCGIAACYDTGSDRLAYRNAIGIKVPDDYFISSMVIVNIPEFRKLYELEDLKKLISSRNWRQHDQDIFNVLCQDSLLIVDAKWSFFEEYDYSLRWLPEHLKSELLDAKKDARVMHYAGANKAWIDVTNSSTEYFWKYAAMTPYFDEFYRRIKDEHIAFKYHIITNILHKDIQYYSRNSELILSSTPYYIGSIAKLKVVIEFLKIENNLVEIDGWYEAIDFLGKLRLFAKLNGSGVITEIDENNRTYDSKNGIAIRRDFHVSIYLDPSKKTNLVEFGLTYEDKYFISPEYISVEQFAPINEHPDSFYACGDYILKKNNGTILTFEKHSRKKVYKYNKKVCRYLRKKGEPYFKKMAIMRWLYYITKPFVKKKNIWLICDNNEIVSEKNIELFKYIKANKSITPYFVATSNCKNIKELKKIGKVLMLQSKKHKLMFFHAKTVISDSYFLPFFLPAYSRANEIRDMIANKKFVYWHNGEEDLSYNIKPWYNVHKFILSNKATYSELLEVNNGYKENNLCFVGNLTNDNLYKFIIESITED